jgi:hypothetical protein
MATGHRWTGGPLVSGWDDVGEARRRPRALTLRSRTAVVPITQRCRHIPQAAGYHSRTVWPASPRFWENDTE